MCNLEINTEIKWFNLSNKREIDAKCFYQKETLKKMFRGCVKYGKHLIPEINLIRYIFLKKIVKKGRLYPF